MTDAPLDSGVRGRVLMGPMCPPVMGGSPCPDRLVEIRLLVIEVRSGDVVARLMSNRNGRFEVNLPPGAYVVEAVDENPAVPPTSSQVRFTIRPHEFTRVTVRIDTGIR